MPTFAYTSFSQNKKKKSRSGRKIGAVGDDKQLIFFTRPKHPFIALLAREEKNKDVLCYLFV